VILTALESSILHPLGLEVGLELDEEDAEGVDDPEDDPVAEEAGHHHQPGLSTKILKFLFFVNIFYLAKTVNSMLNYI
jgi:hypothetical protein